MDRIFAVIDSFNAANWIAIFFGFATFVGVCFTAANYFGGRRERRLRAYVPFPNVRATINRTRYQHGWRSVQLHVVSADEERDFQYQNWRIEHARLVWPDDAVLARAESDDYASGVFYPERPMRALEGRGERLPQRFALEFFMKFGNEEEETKAKFEVTFSDIKGSRRRTTEVWAKEP